MGFIGSSSPDASSAPPPRLAPAVPGFLVPPRAPVGRAKAITRLLRDPDLRRKMGQAGRERVEKCFSVERMVQQTEALYETLLREKGY